MQHTLKDMYSVHIVKELKSRALNPSNLEVWDICVYSFCNLEILVICACILILNSIQYIYM